METATSKLTVLFDPPFWVGLFERESGGRYEACRVVFGAEPRDSEVYAYILDRYGQLDFSPGLPSEETGERTRNPKRAQRLARQQTQCTGIGTKAQQALQLQREQMKTQRPLPGSPGGGGDPPSPAAPGEAAGEAPGALTVSKSGRDGDALPFSRHFSDKFAIL